MLIPDYVLLEHPTELKDKTLILATQDPPFMIGHVWRFRSADEVTRFINGQIEPVYAVIPGYNIIILKYFNLAEGGLPLAPESQQEIVNNMASFYLTQRIIPNAARFKRYQDTI